MVALALCAALSAWAAGPPAGYDDATALDLGLRPATAADIESAPPSHVPGRVVVKLNPDAFPWAA